MSDPFKEVRDALERTHMKVSAMAQENEDLRSQLAASQAEIERLNTFFRDVSGRTQIAALEAQLAEVTKAREEAKVKASHFYIEFKKADERWKELEAERDALKAHLAEERKAHYETYRALISAESDADKMKAERDSWKARAEGAENNLAIAHANRAEDVRLWRIDRQRLADSERARQEVEAELEAYRMRLAGALTAAQGCHSRAQHAEIPDGLPWKNCPTIEAVISLNEKLSAIEAALRQCVECLDAWERYRAKPNGEGESFADLGKVRAALAAAEKVLGEES